MSEGFQQNKARSQITKFLSNANVTAGPWSSFSSDIPPIDRM